MSIRIVRSLSLLLLSSWLLFSFSADGQGTHSAPTLLPASGLQQDVALLRSALEKLHPGLLRYQTQQQSAEAFARLARDLNRDQSQREVYLRLSAFTATLRCGHTYPNFFNQTDAVKHELFDQTDRLPFFFRWIDGKMVIVQDFTPQHSLPRGTTVLSINGVATGTILRTLMPHARSDGHNDAKRIDDLQVVGADTYEATDLLAPMVFAAWHGPFHLAVQSASDGTAAHGHRRSLVVGAVTAAERRREALETHPDASGKEALFALSFLADGTAVLTMPTWEMYNTTWDWSAWLNDALDRIVDRQAPALVVDLRGNEGGNDVGEVLLDRLRGPGTASVPEYATLIRYRTAPEEFRPYLRTYDKRARDWGAAAMELDTPWPTAPPVHYFRLQEAADASAGSATVKKPYKGKVLVLTDASISSATFNFSRAIQREHLGTLVGEPTGGNKRGINGGSFYFLRLPHSGLEVDIPLMGTFPAQAQADEGLTPDVPVRVSPQDIAQGMDRIFQRALVLAGEKP